MMKWFKRSEAAQRDAVPPRAQAPQRPRPVTPAPEAYSAPPALPEVLAEGNSQDDWSAWEDSMTTLDSQFQGLDPSARVQVRDTRPSQLDDLDAFSNLGRRRDL